MQELLKTFCLYNTEDAEQSRFKALALKENFQHLVWADMTK
jgi:hypothetical protein